MMTSEIDMTYNFNVIDSIACASVSERLSWPEIQAEIIKILENLPEEISQTHSEAIEACIRSTQYLLEAPFTLQRICELLKMLPELHNTSTGQYTSFGKFLFALQKSVRRSEAYWEQFNGHFLINKTRDSFTLTTFLITSLMSTFVDLALEQIGFGKFQIITLILSGIGFGAATVELVSVSQIKPFVEAEWGVSTANLGRMSSATFLGEIIGGLVWSFASDRIGRERVFLMTSALMCLFGFGLMLARSYNQFCVLRCLLGFAIGGGLSVDFVYFIECVPTRNRSFRTSFIILIGIFGLIYSALIGLSCLERLGWRIFVALCAVPSAVLFVGRLFWRYESPKFLVAKGRVYEAYTVLRSIAQINGLANLKIEMESREESIVPVSTWTGLRQFWRPTLMASAAFFCQTAAYYGLTLWIYKFLKPWSISPSFMWLLVGAAELPGLAVTSMTLRLARWRRGLLVGAFAGAAAVSLGVVFVKRQLEFILAFCLLYSLIVSIWTIIYAHIPEQFPTVYRSRLFGLAGIAGKVGGLLSPPLFALIWNSPGVSSWCVNAVVAGLFAVGALSAFFLEMQ